MPAACEAKWTGRWIARMMPVTQVTKMKTRNLDLGGSLESGCGGYDVSWIEDQEEQVLAQGGRTCCGRPHEPHSFLSKIVKK